MSILDQIRAAEAAQKLPPSVIIQQVEVAEPIDENLITLDPRLDPDPYGYHSIPLCDRLKAMGWP